MPTLDAVRAPRASFAGAAWIGAPFVVYLAVLAWLWTDAPIWDDYDAILDLFPRLDAARSTGEWLGILFAQHNEHRLGTMTAASVLLRQVAAVDFRLLILAGNLTLLGTFLFIVREFRDAVPSVVAGAVALLMFQWTYYEAALMGSAALPHLGAVFFSFGCLYFAMREGRPALAWCIVFGLFAAASQANGLFALPIAAAGCALFRRRMAFLVVTVFALVAWYLYFRGYVKPAMHPSVFAGLSNPIGALQLFCVILGGVLPGIRASALLGAALVAAVGWGVWKGLWRERPAATLWIVFVFATAASATAGRIGFGVVHASRYGIVSTVFVVVIALWMLSRWRPRSPRAVLALWLLAAGLSLGLTAAVWKDAREYALHARMLRESAPAGPEVVVDRYAGMFYPDPNRAIRALLRADERGDYHPRKVPVHGASVVASQIAPDAQPYGNLDVISASGARVTVSGWSAITAETPQRTFRIASDAALRGGALTRVVARQDVVLATHDPDLVFSGFVIDLDYATEADARRAMATMCVAVDAPRHPPVRLRGGGPGCTP